MVTSQRRKPVVPQRPAKCEEDLQAMLLDREARSAILRDKHSELMDKYPDHWVAFGDNWEFVVSATHRGVADKLEECGAYLPHSVIKQLETNPKRRVPTAWRRRNQ